MTSEPSIIIDVSPINRSNPLLKDTEWIGPIYGVILTCKWNHWCLNQQFTLSIFEITTITIVFVTYKSVPNYPKPFIVRDDLIIVKNCPVLSHYNPSGRSQKAPRSIISVTSLEVVRRDSWHRTDTWGRMILTLLLKSIVCWAHIYYFPLAFVVQCKKGWPSSSFWL